MLLGEGDAGLTAVKQDVEKGRSKKQVRDGLLFAF